MRTDNSPTPLRLLFATATPLSLERSRALTRLLAALPAVGIEPLLLHGWAGAGRLRVDRNEMTGYPVYRSATPEADIAVLALLECPSAAILIGADALALAPPLLAAGIPVLLWGAGDRPVDLGALDGNPSLGLAATTGVEAERLSRLQGTSVHTLPLPETDRALYQGGGTDILVLSDRRGDGAALAFALAEALPAYSFLFPTPETPALWHQARLSRLANGRSLMAGETIPPVRLGLLPACASIPPWEMLAGLMRAGVPLLVGDDPLLAAGIGAAGLSVSLTAPAETWFAAVADLMVEGPARVQAEAACTAQAKTLCPPESQAAALWRNVIDTHIARCHLLTTGRV